MQPDMQNATFLLCNNISMISEAIDADIYVCNMDGRVILCKDLVSDNFEISSNGECIVHSFYAIPQSIINSIGENGSSSPASTLDGVYTKSQMYSARPVIVDGKTVAIVFAVKPASLGALNYLSNSMKIFLVGSLFALVIGAIATYFFTNDLLSPLKDMSRATKCYAKGDFSYRVKVRKNDDTELAHLLRAFNSMASSLALYESSRRSFVANVSHELKTPMTTISGFIDGILDGTIPPEKEKHYLEIVSNETKRLSRLVVAMLNISKIEAGELNLNPVNFNICNDIFNVLGHNIVCFPNGNWVTNKAYYNSQKVEYLSLSDEAISEAEIKANTEYTNALLDVSNDIIVFDLLAKEEDNEALKNQTKEGK